VKRSQFTQRFDIQGGDFSSAGKASTSIRTVLRQIGIDPVVVRRTGIISYEAEMNIVVFARKGSIQLMVTPTEIQLICDDQGPGIADLEMAMQEGFSTAPDEIREMGFGAGMGLPNIKKNADELKVCSVPGQGTRLEIKLALLS
jgi:serine/threonine-protein kinase RsbT